MITSRKTVPLRTILQNCLTHIDKLEATRSVSDHYEKEFQDLKKFSENLKVQKEFACTEGEKELNRKKNRYKDILPFNVSRVVLRELSGIDGSNYVNANYIRGASGSPAYIASQGPLPNTVNDFWRMVVECEIQVIIMACNAEEAGKHKCENYWVEREGEERTFGSAEIKLIQANSICPDFLVRTMRLKYTNKKSVTEERTVCQFHYSAWPDHGVPPLVRPLLDMVRLVRDTQASETLPVLVHCSAGCGRTGTICAIDFVWGLLRLGKLSSEFSLFNLVRDMRKQRVAMVQTKEQYILVHQAVRELFREQLKLIESHHYENLTLGGEPLVKETTEPLYESLTASNYRNHSDEKRDEPMKNMDTQSVDNTIKSPPPLPKKKNSCTPASKQEKEEENLTEKKRTEGSLKNSFILNESFENNVIRRPKIAKLKALFERTPSSEKTKTKSNAISRSHSLGPIRKPIFSEITKVSEDKASKTELPIRSGGKLKVPKLATPTGTIRPLSQVKRSKSLKILKDPNPLLTLLQFSSNDNLIDSHQNTHPSVTSVVTQDVEKLNKSLSIEKETFEVQKKRSLESLIGSERLDVTWPDEMLGRKPTQTDVTKTKSMSLKYQLQMLSHASQKTMNSLANGLGIRERRNSFRQAVSKESSVDFVGAHFGSEGRFASVSEDSSVFVDASSLPARETLTVRSQNGEILRPKNYAANKLNHSLDERGRGYYSAAKDPRGTSQSMRLPSKNKFLFRLKTELENEGGYRESTPRVQPREQVDAAAPKNRGYYLLGVRGSKQHPVSVTRTLPEKAKPQLARTHDLSSKQETKNLFSNGDIYATFHAKTAAHSLATPSSSLHFTDLAEYPKTHAHNRHDLGRFVNDTTKQDRSSESSSSSGARELYTVMRNRYEPQAKREAISRSKSTSYALEENSREQPIAPPRVRRRSTARDATIGTRYSSFDTIDSTCSGYSLMKTQSSTDFKEWSGAYGVDLDTVAASMQNFKKYPAKAVKAGSSGSEQPVSPNLGNHQRKHQYL